MQPLTQWRVRRLCHTRESQRLGAAEADGAVTGGNMACSTLQGDLCAFRGFHGYRITREQANELPN